MITKTKTVKNIYFLLLSLSIAFFANSQTIISTAFINNDLPQIEKKISPSDFIKLTPSSYKELTGKNLNLKQVVQLKIAQAKFKKQLRNNDGENIPKVAYVLLAIFGYAWIVMGLKDDWKGDNWWLNLILYLLCWLPGFVHAMIKMKEYYPEGDTIKEEDGK